MNTTDLLAQIRRAANIRDTHPEWTSTAILDEATHELRQRFGEVVLRSRGGYWRHLSHVPLVADQRGYRIPPRAYANAVDMLELQVGDTYRQLFPLPLRETGSVDSQSGTPTHFIVRNDRIELYPRPSDSGALLRITYTLQPSALVPVSANGVISVIVGYDDFLFAAAHSGAVSGVTVGSRVDIVHPSGAFDLSLIDAEVDSITPSTAIQVYRPPNTSAAFTYTTQDQEGAAIEVGDQIRVAGESEYPMLPEDFHMALAQATAASISIKRGNVSKAQALYAKVEDELQRFANRIEPRVKFSASMLRRRVGPLRGRRFNGGPVAP